MQYEAVLDAVSLYDPENVPEATRKGWQQRLTTFIELIRWSGMAIVDAVLWRPELVDAEGVLRYRRQKSKMLATVQLPDHVRALLRDIPLERDSVGSSQPFRSKDTALSSDTAAWSQRLLAVFALAGITEVKNEVGRARKPHAHMLRDTFAVWHLRHGSRLHVVSKALGHAKTTTTERAYLPWVKELEDAHIAEMRRTLMHRLLGCIPESTFAVDRARQIATQAREARQIPPNEPLFRIGSARAVSFTEEDWFREQGVWRHKSSCVVGQRSMTE